MNLEERVRRVVAQYAKIGADPATIGREADLYQAGMTSHASVSLMLALENEFDLEFPDRMLTRSVFESISSICAAIAELVGVEAA